MLKDHYETIIVGAGPAGLACALKLKELGAEDFVVLERFEFPRDKCCAGYITGKTRLVYESLGLNIEECHYSFIEDFGIWYDGAERQKILNRFLYTNDRIDRVELDHAFFKLAREKGVAIEENARVSAVDLSGRTVTVNDNITVGFGSLVFADGTVGIGSKLQEAEDPRSGRKKNITALRHSAQGLRLDQQLRRNHERGNNGRVPQGRGLSRAVRGLFKADRLRPGRSACYRRQGCGSGRKASAPRGVHTHRPQEACHRRMRLLRGRRSGRLRSVHSFRPPLRT